MPVFISLLRGINVSGQKKILMKDLQAIFESLKLKNVVTYVQSGNVVFESGEKDPDVLAKKIRKKIQAVYSFDVPVIIRTVPEWKKIIKLNPFISEKGTDEERLYVTFLEETPLKDKLEGLKSFDFPPDRFVAAGKEIFLHCPVSYGNSKLNNNFFESKLKVAATTRNWKTLKAILEIATVNY